MGRRFLEEDLLDPTGVYRIESPELLLGWAYACYGWTGWNVEEVDISRTVLKGGVCTIEGDSVDIVL